MSTWGHGSQWKPEEEEQSDEEDYDERFVANKFATVLIIDNTSKMFDIIEDDEDDNCYFKMCIIAILNTLQKVLFKRYPNNLAVMFLFGKDDTLIDFNNDLKLSIKKLNSLRYKSNEELKDMFVCDDSTGMCVHEAMHMGVSMFKKSEKLLKNSHKHVAILTNESRPNCCKNDDECTITVEEFQTFKIELVVLPLVNQFEWKSYYLKMLNRVKEKEPMDAEELVDEGYVDDSLMYVIDQLIQTNTNVTRTIFRYGEESYFHVQVKKFVDVKKLFHSIKVNPKDGQRVFKQTQSAPTNKDQTQYLSRNNLDLRSRIELPIGITLLYVSEKRSSIHYLSHNLFMMLEDDQVDCEGPDVLFDYFWEFCDTKNKVLICTYHKGYVKQKDFLIELRPDRYKGKPCFVSQFLCYADAAKNFTPHVDHVHEDTSGGHLETACEVIEKLKVRGEKAMHFSDPKYDYKTNMIKGHLLSDRNAPWEDPEEVSQFPSKQDVFERIGTNLSTAFYTSYVPHGENKRKRGKK